MKRINKPGAQVKVFFIVASICLVGLSVFSFIKIKSLIFSAEIVNHTNIVKLELERTFSFLKEAETAQRGFILTKDSSFERSYQSAIFSLNEEFEKLKILITDNPNQEVNLQGLRAMMDRRLDRMNYLMNRAGGSDISRDEFLMGKTIMDETKLHVQKMMKVEDDLLSSRSDILSRNAYITPFIIVFFLLFSMVMLLYTYNQITIELKKTFELSEALQLQNDKLIAARNELKASEERYHLMVGEVSDYAIIFLNEQGIIENWNKGAEKIKGYKAEEIIGKNFSVFYPETEKKNNLPQQLMADAVANGKALHEGWRVRKDGTLFWGSVVITALHDSNGKIIGFSKVTRDLTERKIADDKIKKHAEILEEKNLDLENMNRELQSFAYVSSHDLQEPLRKIQTFSSRILEVDFENLSEKGKDYFNRMREAARRMQVLIEDLLEYARTNVRELKFEIVDLHVIVDELREELKEAMEAANASLTYTEHCEIKIVPFQFRQLLHNLITNAMKFAKPGVAPKIDISCVVKPGAVFNQPDLHAEKKYAHIRVSDNGIGFDPQYSKRIFEVFQRLHGKEEFKGTGIGLAICKKIVENHHGVITATSRPDEGAVFDIYLPAD